MEIALYNLFKLFIDTLYTPIFNALESSSFLNPILTFLTDFINSILNMFGTNQNGLKIALTNELIASLINFYIFYLIMRLLIKIFVSITKTFIKGFKNLFNQDEKQKKGWRKQWKRKKA